MLTTGTDPSRLRASLIAIAFVLIVPTFLSAQDVVRGPYLQQVTPTSIVIRWRSSIATTSRVAVGTTIGANTIVETVSGTRENHEVTVSGLAPATLYYYAVGTDTQTLAGGDVDHSFRTAPPVGSTPPLRIWAIGDAGTGTPNQALVRDAYYASAGLSSTDVWLMLGDNAYDDGLDSEYQERLFDMYADLLRTTPFWATRGNHDTSSNRHYGLCTNPTAGEAGGVASGTEAYFSFDHGNVHFICLDSQGSNRSPTGAMLQWLQADLANNLQEWTIAYWHHPPYTKGSHDSDDNGDSGGRMTDMRENALPILEAGGVDLVLGGHSHCYERSLLIDGHYDVSSTFDPQSMVLDGGDGDPAGTGAYQKAPGAAHAGTIAIVMGSSGKQSGGPLDHPAMQVSVSLLGSLVLDVQGSTLTGHMLRENGTIEDTFQIQKGALPSGTFRRGDTNASPGITIGDAILLLAALFLPGNSLSCEDAGDVNDDGVLDLSDAISLLSFSFQGGADPAPPHGICGPDPTVDALTCPGTPSCP